MKKLIVAFSLLLATGFVANNVYAATSTPVKSEVVKKEKEKKKKKKKKGAACDSKAAETKSCAGKEGAVTKSCCQSKK